jgi:two-component system sensor histidine kinase DesK
MTASATIPKQRQRNWAWIWFGYTGFLFIQPTLDPSLFLWLGTLAVFTVFIGIFWYYVRACDIFLPTRFWMIAATFALGLVSFPWNQGASTFFVYAAAFLPFNFKSTRTVLWLYLLECIAIFAEGSLVDRYFPHGAFHIDWPNIFIAMFMVIVIGGGNIFFAEQKRADSKLRAAQQENLALAAVAERERIARDLHDVLGHTLSVIVLKAELAGRLIPIDPVRATAEIADVEHASRNALAEVREAIGGYRARGLAAEIEAARRTFDAAGVTLIAENSAMNAAALTAQEETALALVLREAVTNIVRHAEATSCRLHFVADAGERRLIVEDDGRHAVVREGSGIRGMRARIEAVGGRFLLERGAIADHGTRLTIGLPLREAASQ